LYIGVFSCLKIFSRFKNASGGKAREKWGERKEKRIEKKEAKREERGEEGRRVIFLSFFNFF